MDTVAILHGSELPPVIRTITIALREAVPGPVPLLRHPPRADAGSATP